MFFLEKTISYRIIFGRLWKQHLIMYEIISMNLHIIPVNICDTLHYLLNLKNKNSYVKHDVADL